MKPLPDFPSNPAFEDTKVFRFGVNVDHDQIIPLIEKGKELGWQFMALSAERIHFCFPDPENPTGDNKEFDKRFD